METYHQEQETDILYHKSDLNMSPYLTQLVKNNKGRRKYYNVLANTNTIVIPRRWYNEIGVIHENEYLLICKQLEYIQDIKLKDFQYKLNIKIIVTKTFLHRVKIVGDDRCSYCNTESETIKHLFYNCSIVKRFVNLVHIWLKDHCNIEFLDQFKQFIFSVDTDSIAGKYASLLLKYFIYKSKFKENAEFYLTLSNFKNYFRETLFKEINKC